MSDRKAAVLRDRKAGRLPGRMRKTLDFAAHEPADELKQGYCRGIGSQRLMPVPGMEVARLIVPGGLDCAVLAFTRDTIPEEYRDRKIFFYDFRSAVRLDVQFFDLLYQKNLTP